MTPSSAALLLMYCMFSSSHACRFAAPRATCSARTRTACCRGCCVNIQRPIFISLYARARAPDTRVIYIVQLISLRCCLISYLTRAKTRQTNRALAAALQWLRASIRRVSSSLTWRNLANGARNWRDAYRKGVAAAHRERLKARRGTILCVTPVLQRRLLRLLRARSHQQHMLPRVADRLAGLSWPYLMSRFLPTYCVFAPTRRRSGAAQRNDRSWYFDRLPSHVQQLMVAPSIITAA